MIVVTTDGWDVDHGTLRTYVRDGTQWKEQGQASDVTIGRHGSAWGVGLSPPQHDGPVKKEGDGRSPAGAFAIGTAFGYAPKETTALPYLALGPDDWCIDVAGSPLYNRIVDAREVGKDAVEGSSEPMRRDLHADGDPRYRLGFVIAHNPAHIPGAGSCIFAHLQRAPGEPTAGCTAMSDAAMDELLAWLRPQARPLFVLLPRAQYRQVWRDWGLPEIELDTH